ncbi:unnamed protein product [Onchocerca ochengi]|uniref:Peptidase A1 domain-containing protein n=1 Tax=Onchocerca ochengi TaxID=42157 RepID=A0A182EFH9_ONCOC|nr:unnamed protein product [Onchocerca ochengi]
MVVCASLSLLDIGQECFAIDVGESVADGNFLVADELMISALVDTEPPLAFLCVGDGLQSMNYTQGLWLQGQRIRDGQCLQ